MKTAQWQTNPNAPILPGRWFSLWNVESSHYVAYGKREYGINLKWYERGDRLQPNFMIERRSGSRDPLTYGEVVALKEKRGGYVFYEKREYGINLRWSSKPVYEWQIRGGRTGEVVEAQKLGDSPAYISDTLVSLFNRKIRAYVVYGKRKYGINLVWDETKSQDHR